MHNYSSPGNLEKTKEQEYAEAASGCRQHHERKLCEDARNLHRATETESLRTSMQGEHPWRKFQDKKVYTSIWDLWRGGNLYCWRVGQLSPNTNSLAQTVLGELGRIVATDEGQGCHKGST